MDEVKVKEIFNKIYNLTVNNKISWTSSDPKKNDIFVADVADYNLFMVGTDLSYTFLVRRKTDNVELGRIQTNPFGNNDFDRHIENMFNTIKRKYLKIDEGLNDLLGKLDNF